MTEWGSVVLTIFTSILMSSGLWAFITKTSDRKDIRNQMLVGLAHDRIMCLGMRYIDRGWISRDEYENLNDYLYIPYEKLGGNGSAKRIMEEVRRLPIHNADFKIGEDDYKC